ncbi:AUGMIN subunit 6 isoform X1 [Cynara cardunculus var. scolymus]|uniref:AUGMIN subunit 6 isoform X1 n=1 Tax=Cynara cardunculus var. scolymus TaxID=59895 RepID=UPI000D62C7F9|nr:AUGMIN subunit 6 isoform X1 [Cynara cardunculus var. scolymus]
MTMDREKERETELESAMYTNCLLLGLDPSIIGVGANNGTPRVGLFRHSNPKLGEQLLYFILSSLRGPKDFDKVWPIFDSTQSRDFRKVVQGIISELESQGALPRSNSRVSSLATCCGPRFVELLWQLSLHALREVHRRTYAADVVSNPLPASLTDVAFSHAATLLPVTKARIALERRRFLKNAETAVQRQAMWSNLAHEMTAEYRGLCAEEAYLQQELEKLHDLRNKVKMEGEPWDELVSSSSQNSHLVQRATRLWDSLLSRKSQHEVLASGPIEDLIAHREHRYRISGSSLLAAMDESNQVSSADLEKEQADRSQVKVNRENVNENLSSSQPQASDEKTSRVDDRSGRGQPTVDIAEVLRRWTHALQRIHKQSLHLAKANDGEGPDLLRSANDGGTNGHAESLATTLAEHRQHLASIQVLVNQLKGVAPAIQNSISELSEEVNSISSNLPQVTNHCGRSTSPVQAQSTGRTMESSSDEVADVTSRLSTTHIDKVSSSSTALKLPPLFSLTPNSTAKSGNFYRRQTQSHTNHLENVSENLPLEQTVSNSQVNTPQTDDENDYVLNLKKSVREAALSTRSSNTGHLQDSHSDDGSEHFFVPLSGTGFSRVGQEKKSVPSRSKQLFVPEMNTSLLGNRVSDVNKYNATLDTSNNLDMLNDYDGVNGFISAAASNYAESEGRLSFYDLDETQDQVFSPPFLMDASLSGDSFEDLLAPLSETETALMEH